MNVTDGLLRSWVVRYAAGQITLGELEEAVVPLAWDSAADDNTANRILGILAAADEWSEDELQQRLISVVLSTRGPSPKVTWIKRPVSPPVDREAVVQMPQLIPVS
jgi:hypothetical protein